MRELAFRYGVEKLVLSYTTPRQLLEKIDGGNQHGRRKEQPQYHLPVAATSMYHPLAS